MFVWPPAPSGCYGDCAATGDAKSNAAINASFFTCSTRFLLVHHRPGEPCDKRCRARPALSFNAVARSSRCS